MLIVAVVSWQALSRKGSESSITEATPVEQLPWRMFLPTDRTFRVELPGTPTVGENIGDDVLRTQHHDVEIPGASVSFTVVSIGARESTLQLYVYESRRVGELGASITEQVRGRNPCGETLDSTFEAPQLVGHVRAWICAGALYMVDVRTQNDAPRVDQVLEHIAGSFYAASN